MTGGFITTDQLLSPALNDTNLSLSMSLDLSPARPGPRLPETDHTNTPGAREPAVVPATTVADQPQTFARPGTRGGGKTEASPLTIREEQVMRGSSERTTSRGTDSSGAGGAGAGGRQKTTQDNNKFAGKLPKQPIPKGVSGNVRLFFRGADNYLENYSRSEEFLRDHLSYSKEGRREDRVEKLQARQRLWGDPFMQVGGWLCPLWGDPFMQVGVSAGGFRSGDGGMFDSGPAIRKDCCFFDGMEIVGWEECNGVTPVMGAMPLQDQRRS